MIIPLLALLLQQDPGQPWITETLHSPTLGDRTIYVALPPSSSWASSTAHTDFMT